MLPAAGELKCRVSIQTRSTTADALGAPQVTWKDHLSTWAAIEPVSGRELIAAQAMQSEVTHQITIRYRSEFENVRTLMGMRIVYRSRFFDITSALNVDEANGTIVMLATEGLKQG